MGLRGPQPGTGGRPRKSLAEKVTEGNPGKRKLKVLDFEQIATEPEGVDMPPPKEFYRLRSVTAPRSPRVNFTKKRGNGWSGADARNWYLLLYWSDMP